jgi:hypothetical protein
LTANHIKYFSIVYGISGRFGKMCGWVRREHNPLRRPFLINEQTIIDYSRAGIPIVPDEADRAVRR